MEAKIDPGGSLAPETDRLFAPGAAQEATMHCCSDPYTVYPWSRFQDDLGLFPRRFWPASKPMLGCFQDELGHFHAPYGRRGKTRQKLLKKP